MKNYPTITSESISFTVTIVNSIVPIIADQVYIQNSAPLLITFESFGVSPNDVDVGQSSIDAFIFKCSTIPAKIDPSSDCLEKVVDFEWITLDSKTRTLTVKTSKSEYVGDY